MSDITDYIGNFEANWDELHFGIEYEVMCEVIEDVEAEGLPKHTDGNNVALRSSAMEVLCWTEDLGANAINLDGYLYDHWNQDGSGEIELSDGRILVPDWDTASLDLHFSREALLKAAQERDREDSWHFAYVLAHWVYLARKAQHISDSSVRSIHAVLEDVMNHVEVETPGDVDPGSYGGVSR